MKIRIAILSIAVVVACVTLALTPQEKIWIGQARSYAEKAKAQASEQQKVIQDQNKENEMLGQIASGQEKDIGTPSGQIEESHKNEQTLADWKKANEGVIEQVNKYWGLGAFAYGAKVLGRHLFWLSLIGGVAAIALLIFAPAVFGFLKTFFGAALTVITSIISRIAGLFKKKG